MDILEIFEQQVAAFKSTIGERPKEIKVGQKEYEELVRIIRHLESRFKPYSMPTREITYLSIPIVVTEDETLIKLVPRTLSKFQLNSNMVFEAQDIDEAFYRLSNYFSDLAENGTEAKDITLCGTINLERISDEQE